ncbi:MAG TPA: hypothetical protein VMR34_05160 [Candidatus Saccharimonadales bacterium]|nr:hypothetical protein [Candidatus Saccharimonadales bacterium]
MAQVNQKIILPINIITLSDVSGLIRELENIDNFFLQVKVRRAGDSITLPKSSKSMEDLLQYNKLSLLREVDREKLKLMLMTIRSKAPKIHISFSADPTRAFLEKITAWFREEINPLILLQVGLQPNIGAGFTLRTSNHFYDFSLRQYVEDKKHLLLESLIGTIKQ